MIRVTRLDGSQFYINSDLIQTLESSPDTHVHLTTGAKYVVRETDEEVVHRILAFRRAMNRPERGQRAQIRLLPRQRRASS